MARDPPRLAPLEVGPRLLDLYVDADGAAMTTPDVELVHAALLARGWQSVAPALGLRAANPRQRQPCALHGGKSDSLTLDTRDGRLTWICATHCGAGDVLGMIQQLRGIGFREALREAADLAGVELDSGDDSDEHRAQRERERAAYLAAAAAARNREPESSPGYPPAGEIAALWDSAVSVTSDPEVCAYLAKRAVDPPGVAAGDVLRAVAPGAPLPRWARYRGSQEASLPWVESTHRILARAWDAEGTLRSVRAWRIGDDPSPKRLPPAGYRASGLVLANGSAVAMLRGGWGPCRIVIAEGEPDWAVWCTRIAEPVIGILSGSWTPEIAARIPFGSEVIVRTHTDAAGDKYARQVIDSLRGRATIHRLRPEPDSEAA